MPVFVTLLSHYATTSHSTLLFPIFIITYPIINLSLAKGFKGALLPFWSAALLCRFSV
ncbi:hypothetical protein SCG7109_AB_00260 [Chlamydiales bacterium SCGC AG-110-M15]|nr:hypothetical protein SCG7109_AB_00260 [Chlamydiales bacterium SCGC AG-110-M15]